MILCVASQEILHHPVMDIQNVLLPGIQQCLVILWKSAGKTLALLDPVEFKELELLLSSLLRLAAILPSCWSWWGITDVS